MISELERREKLLGALLSSLDSKGGSFRSLGEQHKEGREFSLIYFNGMWPEGRFSENTDEVIRDMVDFQIDAMRQKTNFVAVQDFIRDNPEEMCNRILSHIQYVFGITSLEGLIPKMNQIYIFTQELATFMKSLRDTLGVSTKDCSDSALLVEVERLVSDSKTLAFK